MTPRRQFQTGTTMSLRHLPTFLLLLLLTAAPLAAQQNPDGRLPLHKINDPYLLLLRDEAALQIINATSDQREALSQLSDRLDAIFWPKRHLSEEAASSSWDEATQLARREAAAILTAAQQQRVDEIVLWIQGTRALLRDEIAEQLALRTEQRESIQEIIESTAKQIAELEQQANAGEPTGPLEKQALKLQETEQRSILAKLNDSQERAWQGLLGDPVDTSKLGRVTFRAPDLVADEQSWINGDVSTGYQERPVTVVHFFANGCINCIRNYPHYLGWDDSFRDKGVVIVGVHTPETQAERDVERLKQKVAEAGFEFPVLVDNEKQNWDAWGTTMWPSVYLVDRHGRIRYWWYGELNWQGADGEQRLRRRIEELLTESRATSRP